MPFTECKSKQPHNANYLTAERPNTCRDREEVAIQELTKLLQRSLRPGQWNHKRATLATNIVSTRKGLRSLHKAASEGRVHRSMRVRQGRVGGPH